MQSPSADLPILFEHVSVVVGSRTLLDDINLNIRAGSPTVVIGPNGSGKTTLLRTGMGLLTIAAGRVTRGESRADTPRQSAIVFQRPMMFRRRASSNIQYALKVAGIPAEQHAARIAELLGLVGLEGFGERPARRLSVGEQQRLALARALARNPEVLFLDEPTASLDPAGTKAFEDVIHSIIARGIKIVMSTHDLGEARRLAGDVVLLHKGRIAEVALATDFFTSPRTIEAERFIAGELLL